MPLVAERPYIYSPIINPDGIRFIILHPGILADPINISIYSTTLARKPPYEALSYTWGDLSTSRPIQVRTAHSRRPCVLPVTENLEVALRHLRQSRTIRLMWIDALSINQNDLEERSQQVMRMGDIFSQAASVSVWLGPAADRSDEAILFVDQVSHLGKLDELIRDPEAVGDWQALAALMRRPWFSRRWIIQEIAFARNATVYCGTKHTKWSDFADAVSLYGDKFDDISMLAQPYGAGPLKDGICRGVAAHALVTVLNSTIRKASDGRVIERLSTLEKLMSDTATFLVTNPRDAVYAVLSLAKDGGLRFLGPVDYKKSVAQICKDLIRYSIAESSSLDIICRPWAPVHSDMPTWIPQISRNAFATAALTDCRFVRINADSLVGPPRRGIYSAAASTHAESFLTKGRESFVLRVKGFQLGVIVSVEEPALSGIIPGRWIKVLMDTADKHSEQLQTQTTLPEFSFVPDLFWRTLVADRGIDGNSPPGWYRRACEEIYMRNDKGSFCEWDTTKLIENPIDDGTSTTMTAFCRRMQSVTWNRRLAVMSDGSIALVPPESKKGDIACILFGCSVPVILRQHTDNFGEDYEEFVGECYINSNQGVMDGQAIERLKDGRYEIVYFDLR